MCFCKHSAAMLSQACATNMAGLRASIGRGPTGLEEADTVGCWQLCLLSVLQHCAARLLARLTTTSVAWRCCDPFLPLASTCAGT